MNEPLSYLVKYKNVVDEQSTTEQYNDLNEKLNSILNIVGRSTYANADEIVSLNKQAKLISTEIEKFNTLLAEFKDNITDTLRDAESEYKIQSYRMYEEGINNDSADYILDRALFKSLIYKDHIKDYFNSRIGALSSWKYPGIFIRPEHGEYVSKMTASDPLYVVDQLSELLAPTTNLWNDTYQSRVRYKIINEERDTIFKNFPEGQIGLVVAMNFMNYKPIEVIKQYLFELFDLLRPGGSFLFTYNNCNYPLAVKNFETALFSYTPESLISPMCEMVGYEVTESYNDLETSVSWLELRKPGELTTQRGGQCLGKVVV